MRDNQGWGLFVDGVTSGTVIRRNIIEDTGSGQQSTGIRIGNKTDDVTLEGNRIKAKNRVLDERQSN